MFHNCLNVTRSKQGITDIIANVISSETIYKHKARMFGLRMRI